MRTYRSFHRDLRDLTLSPTTLPTNEEDDDDHTPVEIYLTVEEQRLLSQIRRRKAELLSEIGKLQDEIEHVTRELSSANSSAAQLDTPTTQQLLQQKPLPPTPPNHTHQHPHTQQQQQSQSGGGLVVVPLAEVERDNESLNGSESGAACSAAAASATLLKHQQNSKLMSLGCKKFNMDPKKGIEFLNQNGLLLLQPLDLAQFLYRGEGLNKTAIGDYLGEKIDLNEKVLKAFVDLHDFTDLLLVQALRQFLWSFRLPGEAQKIDRMMECFATRYCQLNPDIFTNTDTCYVLSFAIIMLNTSLHNPSVKEKPSVDQFVSMNRGINNGGDLNRDLLESLYASIQAEPFKIPEDDGNDLMHTFFNPDKEGWLWKQGGRYKTWKRRWFILNDNCLYYFEFTTDKEPRGIIPLENVGVREVAEKRPTFEIFAKGPDKVIKACKTDSDGRVVEGKHSVYKMMANDEEEKTNWIRSLSKSISYSPFYELLGSNRPNTAVVTTTAASAAAATSFQK